MTINFRQATLEDVDKIAEITKYSYDEPEHITERFRKFFDINYQEHYVGVENNKIVVSLRSHNLQQNVRGVFKPMAGIGMVATSPEARRKGYVRGLLRYTFKELLNKRCAVSSLYPFKDSFYKQFGFKNAKPHQFVELDPLWFSNWNRLPEGYSIERMKIEEGVDELRSLHDHVVSQFNGGVKSSDDRWIETTKDYPAWLILVRNKDGITEGAMYYEVRGYGNKVFGEDNVGTLKRIGFYTKSLPAKHALFYYLHLHSDQIIRVILPIYPHEDNYPSWVNGYHNAKIHQHIINQTRIVNVLPALDDIPVHSKGSLEFQVIDPFCEWNNKVFPLASNGERLKVVLSSKNESNIKIAIEGLTALLYGIMDSNEVEYFGWLKGADIEERHLLAKWFPKLPYCCTEFF